MMNRRFIRFAMLAFIASTLPFLLTGCESIGNTVNSVRSTVGGIIMIIAIILGVLGFFRIRNFSGTIGSGFPAGRWLFSGVGLIIWALLLLWLGTAIYPSASKKDTVNVTHEPAVKQSTTVPAPPVTAPPQVPETAPVSQNDIPPK